jgi:hypothetical protein|tara:strand:- start:2647 stop:3474 length:828 start_codon:yes stop_codon:yes gene_type:complete
MLNIVRKKKFIRRTIASYNYFLFIAGSGRTGSTLLGQLINYHPQCLMATEYWLDKKVVIENGKLGKHMNNLAYDAIEQFECGLENHKKFGKTIERFQPRWRGMSQLAKEKEIEKRTIKVLGDKIGGRLNSTYEKEPEKCEAFFNTLNNVSFIHLLRNPVDSAASYLKSHGHKYGNFSESCAAVVNNHVQAHNMLENITKPCLIMYYEDLLYSPKRELKGICKWLGLDCSDGWLEKISTVVNSSGNEEKYSEEHLRTARRLIEKYDAGELFGKYMI